MIEFVLYRTIAGPKPYAVTLTLIYYFILTREYKTSNFDDLKGKNG
jgi:hypothetical protein